MPAVHSASVFDVIPLLSQSKSLFQLITGDVEGAGRTQMNFLNEGLITSQARSIYYAVTGHPKKALEIQKDFGRNLEPIIDGLPFVGHLKGSIHLAVGDVDHGLQALVAATANLGALAGGVLAGPAGAIASQVMIDAAVSGIDKAVRKDKAEPYGIFHFLTHLPNSTASDFFETLVGMGLTGYSGSKIRTTPMYKPNMNRNTYELMTAVTPRPVMMETEV